MIMAKNEIPVIGKPFFILKQNNWSDKVKVTTGLNSINTLVYISVDAIKCMSVGYTDETMTRIVINKDYKGADGEDMSYTVNADEANKRRDSTSIFTDELEANAVAAEMNKQFQKECKQILDVVSQVYHEYDNLIGILKSAK